MPLVALIFRVHRLPWLRLPLQTRSRRAAAVVVIRLRPAVEEIHSQHRRHKLQLLLQSRRLHQRRNRRRLGQLSSPQIYFQNNLLRRALQRLLTVTPLELEAQQ